MRRGFFFALLLLFAPLAAQAQTQAITAPVTRGQALWEAMFPRSIMEISFQTINRNSFDLSFSQTPENVELEKQYPGIQKACRDAYMSVAQREYNASYPLYIESRAKDLSSIFTVAEAKQIIAFFDSPIGRKFRHVTLESPILRSMTSLADVERTADRVVESANLTDGDWAQVGRMIATPAGQKLKSNLTRQQANAANFAKVTSDKIQVAAQAEVQAAAAAYMQAHGGTQQ
ncbi:hypothetical protein J2W40_003253 [Sphingobium xenophagum]|uniref:DUF2059 domain-containing protein n=1 Tax=Sphingobium xenophagum TaxID=121428 RepID=A0ABU1X5I6_SPHXE|nr:hypothetical protein [Sphingobium xenophagum]MDR7156412.1 hypothetical protein [Sphingobium xenophagum]